jgi:hypothetical protein
MKINTNIIKTIFFLFSFFIFLNASAQAPQKMSYQSVIRNASNALIANTVVGVQISVIQTTATGTAVYVERQTPTTNLNGLASIEIGGGTLISGNFATINWANGPYFIKTETDPTGGTAYTIAGTTQLLSVPYALFAANSGSANTWGLTGNTGTDPINNFIGTTDAKPLVFKVRNTYAGRISNDGMVALGIGAANVLSDASNVAVGKDALLNNGTGATGNQAKSNTAIGNRALVGNTTGLNNTAIGDLSLANNITGSQNTTIGKGADVIRTSLTNATAIGADAKVNCSDCLVLGAAELSSLPSVNVGIGTSTPTYKLDISTAGVAGLRVKSTAIFCVFDIDAANGDAAIRFANNGVLKWNIRNRPSDDNFEIYETGGGGSRMVVQKTTGNIGVGGVDPITKLHIKQPSNGLGLRLTNNAWDWDIYTSNGGGLNFNYNGINKSYIDPVNGSYVATSDARLKKDVNKMPTILDKVMALQPKTYKYIDNKETDRLSTGFIAQEVMPLFPDLVTDFQRTAKDTTDTAVYHGINYAGFSVVAIKAIQEQQQQIEALKTQLAKMQAAIDAGTKK